LVNTQIAEQNVRAYILMGDEINTKKVHPDAQLILYNSAFWGSPTAGAIINNGIVRYQQANFQSLTARGLNKVGGIELRGGKVHVYSSFFAQRIPNDADDNSMYAWLHSTGNLIELTNNYYISGLKIKKEGTGHIFGSDIVK